MTTQDTANPAARERRGAKGQTQPGEPVALALDIGTSSIRSMVFDVPGNEIAGSASQESYDLSTQHEGEATFDADAMLERACRCIDQTCNGLGEHVPVAAVGISCFWHSLLGLDARGDPGTPVYHLADNRAAAVVDKLRRTLDEEGWKQVTGTVFHSSFWPAKLRWLREADPAVFAGIARWTSVADYFASRLLGTDWTSLCMASGTGLCELSTGRWSEELANITGVGAETLPAIVDRDQAAELIPAYARRWPRLAGVPWFPALGDGACANIGCGATDRSRIALTLGTTGAMRVLDEASLGAGVTAPPGLWTYRLDRQTVVHGAAITNGGGWIDFMRDILMDGEGELLDEAFSTEPAAHGLTVLPFLSGERSPIWNDRARAAIAGLSARTSRADVARAGLEAVGHRLALLYEDISPVAGPEHSIVANGAALLKSHGWQQIVADSLAHPIVTLSETVEASARGAAIAALHAAKVLRSISDVDDLAASSPTVLPDQQRANIYRGERERQERLRQLLYPGSSSWDYP